MSSSASATEHYKLSERILPPNAEQAPRWMFFVVILGAAVLRFAALGRQPLWLDEATDASFAARSFWNCVFAEYVHPPLYRTCLHFIMLALGNSAWAMRFLPAVFGILTVQLAGVLAHKYFARATVPALILAATSPFLIFYSQENRNYSLFILLTLLSTWAFLRFRESASGLPLYVAICVLLIYTHYLSVFVLLAHEIVYWSYSRQQMRGWILGRIALACTFTPWLLWAAGRYHSESRLFIPPALLVPNALLRFFVGYGIAAPDAVLKAEPLSLKIVEEAPVIVPIFCIFAWLLWSGVRYAARDLGKNKQHSEIATLFAAILLVPWATLPLLAPWVQLSQERYLSFQAPFILLLIAAGLVSLRGRVRLVAGVMLALTIGFCLAAYYGAPGRAFGYRFRYGKENWQAAAAFVRQQHADVVIIAPGFLQLPLDRYSCGGAREIQAEPHSEAIPAVGDAQTLALVISHAGQPEERLRLAMSDRYTQVAEGRFPSQNLIRVIVYHASRP